MPGSLASLEQQALPHLDANRQTGSFPQRFTQVVWCRTFSGPENPVDVATMITFRRSP